MVNNRKAKVEDMLRKYTCLTNKIKNIELEIEKLSYNNYIPSKSEMIKSLKKDKRKDAIEVEKIDNALAVLDIKQRKIIELRYMLPQKLNWNEISEVMQTTDKTCRTIRDEAIKKIIPIIFI